MNKPYNYLICTCALLFLIQCETPGDPNFTLSQRIDTPLIAEANFQFLGGKNALIDTTSEDLQNLFHVAEDGFITLSKQETLELDDLDDALPDIQVNPVQFEAEVGEIELNDFSSQDENGNLGEADFSELTGLGIAPQQGDPIPGAQTPSPVEIPLNTDFFESAAIKRGGINITLRNELGFNIDMLSLQLFSGNTSVGTAQYNQLSHNTTQSELIVLIENPGIDPELFLSDISVEVEIEWSGQTMQDDAGSLIVNDIRGVDLFASEVVVQVPQQEFEQSGSIQIPEDEFRFEQPGHFVQMKSGTLSVEEVFNFTDVDIDRLIISFPGILFPPYSPSDSLVISFEGANSISRNNSLAVSQTVDLAGARIFGSDNSADFNIYAETEDTQTGAGGDLRTIREDDFVSAVIEVHDLAISEAFGIITRRTVFLNYDDPSNGEILDLLNEEEAEIIEIEGIKNLSEKVDGLEFTNSNIEIQYAINTDLPASVTAAFMGTDASGNRFFLSGAPGSGLEVSETDFTNRLTVDEIPIPIENLIQFDVNPTGDPEDLITFLFNRDNSTVVEFLNQLPVEIRFIGLATFNEDEAEGTLKSPIRLDPAVSVNIPLSLRAENATFVDTTSQDLGNLPGPDDDSSIEEGSLFIQYSNRIPLGFNLQLELLDEDFELITSIPLGGQEIIEFDPAPVDGTGFSLGSAENSTMIILSREQLDQLNRTREVRLSAGLLSSDGGEVRIRDIDDITIRVSGRFRLNRLIN
jgi:hypothetical protein